MADAIILTNFHRIYLNDSNQFIGVKPLGLPDNFEPFMVRWQRRLDERRQQKEESIWDE